MATKISEYSASPASNTDLDGINLSENVMVPSDVNDALRMQMAHLKDLDTGTSALTSPEFASATMTGDLNFGDNNKATFGDAVNGDLRIYHDALNSFIQDAGTGSLFVQATNLILKSNDTGENYMRGIQNGTVELYHNGIKKIETTASGIDVTGTMTADTLSLNSSADFGIGTISSDANWGMYLRSDNVGGSDPAVADFNFASNANENRLLIGSGGDISFYDSTGVSQGFLWDASTQRLGLGTTVPSNALTLNSAAGGASGLRITSTEGSGFRIRAESATTTMLNVDSGESMLFGAGGTERMRIDSVGNVGIGGSPNANAKLTLSGSGLEVPTGYGVFNDSGGANATGINFTAAGSNLLSFYTGNSERMRIDSSGTLLVGATAEADWETVAGFRTRQSGSTTITRSAAPVLYVNRLTSNGDLVDFRKDGTTVGSIGVDADSTNLMIGNGVVGLRFVEGSNHIRPANIDTGGNRDNAIDLGYGSSRFKDGYFSGTLNSTHLQLGASGSAVYFENTNYAIQGSANNGYLKFTTAGAERMRINNSGRVGINTTTMDAGLNIKQSADNAYQLKLEQHNTTDGYGLICDMTDGALAFSRYESSAYTERMRINTNGSLGVGSTLTTAGVVIEAQGTNGWNLNTVVATTAGIGHIVFSNGNGVVGSIVTSGTATAYNTASDYRLKENVTAITSATDRLNQLNPVRFNFIADADTTVDGFIAHEVATVIPEAISGEKDEIDADGNAVMQGIDQSKLVPLLTAALQEALTKIEQLETRITALEV